MKSKIEIGTKVQSKSGTGVITKVITKSTGYVEVTYAGGAVKKEMAFNLANENGEPLKQKPATRESNPKPADRRPFVANTIKAAVNEGDSKGALILRKIEESSMTDIVSSIVRFAKTKFTISDKQAYVLACFCEEKNINI
jgi:hypothetical protein